MIIGFRVFALISFLFLAAQLSPPPLWAGETRTCHGRFALRLWQACFQGEHHHIYYRGASQAADIGQGKRLFIFFGPGRSVVPSTWMLGLSSEPVVKVR